jgi:membrane associated rhomboid family serine protease
VRRIARWRIIDMADEKTFRPLLYVMIAGAVGGLTSWLLQWLAGLTPFQKPAIFGIPALVVVGAVAAVLGVYLIANSDTTELRHTLAFALVCGVFWQPVFDAAKLYVTHSVTEPAQNLELIGGRCEYGTAMRLSPFDAHLREVADRPRKPSPTGVIWLTA